jgi:hypothetical protein
VGFRFGKITATIAPGRSRGPFDIVKPAGMRPRANYAPVRQPSRGATADPISLIAGIILSFRLRRTGCDLDAARLQSFRNLALE